LAETIRARKSLGQHFLTDPVYCRRIADFAQAGPEDAVVEIGPGTGRLTGVLLERSPRVVGDRGRHPNGATSSANASPID
jgi:16S rRNA (adenine1518-N6/adenine1519-N6)-dimethyltransferase